MRTRPGVIVKKGIGGSRCTYIERGGHNLPVGGQMLHSNGTTLDP
jgi:hypothetical protein